jgi:ankyrin repeat protein
MNRHSFLSRFCHSLIPRRAAVTLIALAWSSLAFGGEIHDAARIGDLAKVKVLLKDNPDLVFCKDNEGATPLHEAALHGSKDVTELLLASKAEVNAKDNLGGTPLHWAAFAGHKDVAELLLANKASVNAKSNKGVTPLHLAALNGYNDLAELLRQHGGLDTSATDSMSTGAPAPTKPTTPMIDTAIRGAAEAGDLQKVEAMLKDNPDLVLSKDKDGMTPLHFAAVKGYRNVAELLLSHGAEVNAKNKGGFTPLHVAAFEGHKDVVELLLAHKAEVNARDEIGSGTPFHYASSRGQTDVAKLLRQHGGHE